MVTTFVCHLGKSIVKTASSVSMWSNTTVAIVRGQLEPLWSRWNGKSAEPRGGTRGARARTTWRAQSHKWNRKKRGHPSKV